MNKYKYTKFRYSESNNDSGKQHVYAQQVSEAGLRGRNVSSGADSNKRSRAAYIPSYCSPV